MPPTRRHLPSPPGFGQPIIGFSVGQQGDVAVAPAKFVAGRNDIVLWIVANASGQAIDVSLEDFLVKVGIGADKGTVQPPQPPFIWLVSNALHLNDGKVGLIAGQRNPAYRFQGALGDSLSYTIRVQPFNIDYDPDGDIKP